MKVRIRESLQTGGHEVYLLDIDQGRRCVLRPREATGAEAIRTPGWDYVPIEEGSIIVEPSVRLPEGALEALLEEGLKIAAPDGAVQRHLDDATEVRDRLLGMIESTWGSRS